MSISAIPTLGAGSVFAFEDPANPDVWLDLLPCLQFGEVGTEAQSFIQATPIHRTTHLFISDIDSPVDVSMVFNDVDDAAYENFLRNFVDTKQTVRVRYTYSNNRVGVTTLALSGLKMSNPEFGSQLQTTVSGKQSDSPTWSAN